MNAASLAARAPAGTPADLVAVKVTQAKDEHAWDQFVTQHPESTCEHLWAWRTVITSVFGHKCIYLTAERSGAIVGVLPLVLFDSRLFGRSVVSLPFLNYGGVLASEPEAVALLANEAERVGRDFGAAYVELRHRAPLIPSLPRREHKLALTRPLPASSDELWAKVDRKVRNQVRKAQKDGLTVVSGGAELVDQFYKDVQLMGGNRNDTSSLIRRLRSSRRARHPGCAWPTRGRGRWPSSGSRHPPPCRRARAAAGRDSDTPRRTSGRK